MEKQEIPKPDLEKVIDPETGRDITAEYVKRRLIELADTAEEIIRSAIEDYRKNPINKQAIYLAARDEIFNKLGMGSIGPATAVAAPLMRKKLKVLAEVLSIDYTAPH